jgi:hypothetical protein
MANMFFGSVGVEQFSIVLMRRAGFGASKFREWPLEIKAHRMETFADERAKYSLIRKVRD